MAKMNNTSTRMSPRVTPATARMIERGVRVGACLTGDMGQVSPQSAIPMKSSIRVAGPA